MLLHKKLSKTGQKHLKDILKDIDKGKTTKEIYSRFKRRDIEYSKKDFTDDIREIKKADREYLDIGYVHKGKPLPDKYYKPSTILSDKKYMTKFLIHQYNKELEEYEEKFFTVTHDKLYSRKLLENRLTPEYIRKHAKVKYDLPIEILSIKPFQGFYNY